MNQTVNSAELVAETEKSEDQQGWLATFADLMSLLMCFFVLLLSFSELDVVKFKQIAGSMKTAFGVQRDIEVEQIPKGTSVIKQEFSPSINQPTLLEQIRQVSAETESVDLSQGNVPGDSKEAQTGRDNDGLITAQHTLQQTLEQELTRELNLGQFELDHFGQQLVIRINEKGSFASGSGYLQPMFKPSLRKLSSILADIPGQIVVAGHTDNVPVNNELYQDNLELSATRALAIARVLKQSAELTFVQVNGMGDSMPLVPNLDARSRARNRRVEITIEQGNATIKDLSIQ